MSWEIISYSHTGCAHCSHRCRKQVYEMLQNRKWYHKIAECIARYKWLNDIWFYGLLTAFQPRNGMRPTILTLAWNPPKDILMSPLKYAMVYLISINYKWLLSVDQAFCKAILVVKELRAIKVSERLKSQAKLASFWRICSSFSKKNSSWLQWSLLSVFRHLNQKWK